MLWSPVRLARRLALCYLLLASLWILLSDWALRLYAPPSVFASLQTYKGELFVLVTSFLLFLLLRRELGRRRQAEERVEQALRREEAMGHLHSRILALRSMGEFSRELEEEWVEELRRLSLPVYRISLQFPASRAGYFATSPWILGQNIPSTEVLLADYPWVKEAWDRGQPVVVDRPRLERAGFQPEVFSLVEVPLPGGGSLGVNSQVQDAFDAEAVHTLQQFAGLVATTLQRLQDFEEVRRLAVRHEAILGALPDIVMEVDADKVYTWANPAGYEFFGQDVIGREAAHYFAGEQDIYSQVQPLFNGDPGLFYVESWQRRRDGRRRLLAWWCRALKDAQGSVVGALSTARDITDHWQAEEALHHSERNLAEAQRLAHLGSHEYDVRADRLFWSDEVLRIFGISPEEFCGRASDFYDRVHPDDREGVQRFVAEANARDGQGEREYRIVRPDGSVRFVQERFETVFGEDHRPARYLGTIQDITEKKQAEVRQGTVQRVREAVWWMKSADDLGGVLQALKDSLEQLGIPFQDCDVNIVTSRQPLGVRAYGMDRAGRWRTQEVPASSQRLLLQFWEKGEPVYRKDLDKEDLYQEKDLIEQLFHRPVRAVLDLPFAQGTLAVNSSQPEAFSEFHIAALHELAQVLEEGLRRQEDLQAIAVQRRQAEERLKLDLGLQQVRNEILQMQGEEDWKKVTSRLHRELSDLVEFEDCGINLLDRQRHSYLAHEMTPAGAFREKVYQEPLPRALVQALDTSRPVYRRTRAEMDQIEDPIEKGKNCVLDVPFSGGTVAINSSREDAFRERDIQILEQFAQVMSEAHRRLEDLKTLATTETQLRQAQKMESIGRLAGGVAHDFNNLLTIINGNTQLLLSSLDPADPRREEAEDVYQAGEKAARLVRQLLAFSRRQVLQPQRVDLNRVIVDLGKMLGRLIGEDVELSLHLDPYLGLVYVDPGQVEQALLNLVVNARDAMPRGGTLVLETAHVELDERYSAVHGVEIQPGPYVLLAVSDTGVGMDPATQAHLFEPFFTTKEPGKGTGLGLATVYGIVKQSGGYIWVYSEAGKGTTFKIYLPRLGQKEQAQDGEEAQVGREVRGRETVLVVEDDEGVRKLAVKILRDQGYTVLEARQGAEALQFLAQQDRAIALVLTDVVMPGMSGIELAELVSRSYPGVGLLYMSGYSEHAALPRDLQEKGRVFVQKPFDPDTLVHQVRQVLERSHQEE